MKRLFWLNVGLFAAQALLQAQTAVRRPESGFVFDAGSGGVRAILGSPGAATLGPLLLADVDYASPSGDGTRAVAIRDGRVWWLSPLPMELPIAKADLGIVTWNASAASAAVQDLARQAIVVISEEEGQPKVREMRLPEGTVTAMAGPFGDSVFAAVTGGPAPGLYRVREDAPAQLLAADEGLGAIALSPKGVTLFAVSSDGARMWLISNPSGSAAARLTPIAVPPGVVGVGISAAQDTLHVAHANVLALSVIAVDSGSLVRTIALDVPVLGMIPVGGSSNYLLASRREVSSPLWLLQTSSSTVFFVPASRQ